MPKRHRAEEELFSKLSKDFHEIVSNENTLRTSTERFLNNLIDEITLGVIFDHHRKFKTRGYDLDGDSDGYEVEKCAEIEMFAQYCIKKYPECPCPKCNRSVAAPKFGEHLAKCMGFARSTSRNVARRVNVTNSKEKGENSTTYSDAASDNDDDVDWSPGDKSRRKKKKQNGKKKSRSGTPKKLDSTDSVNVDVEGDDDNDLSKLRDFLQESSPSPTSDSSTGSNHSGTKKKDKTKGKKIK